MTLINDFALSSRFVYLDILGGYPPLVSKNYRFFQVGVQGYLALVALESNNC